MHPHNSSNRQVQIDRNRAGKVIGLRITIPDAPSREIPMEQLQLRVNGLRNVARRYDGLLLKSDALTEVWAVGQTGHRITVLIPNLQSIADGQRESGESFLCALEVAERTLAVWVETLISKARLLVQASDVGDGVNDICAGIIDDHRTIREAFRELYESVGSEDTATMLGQWRRLQQLLETHARAEEDILFPAISEQAKGQSQGPFKQALPNHNEIRGAVAQVANFEPATQSWWRAVEHCRQVNEAQLKHEENVLLPQARITMDADVLAHLGHLWSACVQTKTSEHRSPSVDPAFADKRV